MRLTSRLLPSSLRSPISRARLLETLESRLLLAATPYTPAQIRQAYGIDQITGNGAGQTIALVEAYADTHVATDLNTFDQAFSINGGTSTLAAQYGPASAFLTVTTLGVRPRTDAGWGMETALDVEWAHVVAPGAKIAVIQANSASLTDLLAAVDYARTLAGVSVISMSWGSNEFSGESAYDSHFTTPTGHTNITFVASSGDSGAGAGWPAVSANVVAVGGTTLTINADGSYGSETVWSGSGGGYSSFIAKPVYQNAVNSTNFRGNPDVAYDADPNTGFYVYDGNYNGQSGWWSVGGTSAGAPQWAALVALADQARSSALTSSQTLKTLYTLPAADFHDITVGSNGFSATAGYDLATGLGTPYANLVVAGLTSSTVATSAGDYSGSAGGGGGGGPGKGHGNGNNNSDLDIILSYDLAITAPARVTTNQSPAQAATIAVDSTPISLPAIISFTPSASMNVTPSEIKLAVPTAQVPQQAPVMLALQPADDPSLATANSESASAPVAYLPANSEISVQPVAIIESAAMPISPASDTQPLNIPSEAASSTETITPARTGTSLTSRWYLLALTLPFLGWSSISRKLEREETH